MVMSTEAASDLSAQRYYRKLDQDPTEDFASKVVALIEEMFEYDYLKKETRTSTSPQRTQERLDLAPTEDP